MVASRTTAPVASSTFPVIEAVTWARPVVGIIARAEQPENQNADAETPANTQIYCTPYDTHSP